MNEINPVKILLIEDDRVDQEAVRRAFKKLKIANPLEIAEDGLEGLEILKGERKGKIKRPYVVLLDLNMPRMNGHEFLEAVRSDQDLKDIVVFVLTTSRDEKDLLAAYEKNVAGYIVKSDVENGFLEGLSMLEHYWRVVELPIERE